MKRLDQLKREKQVLANEVHTHDGLVVVKLAISTVAWLWFCEHGWTEYRWSKKKST